MKKNLFKKILWTLFYVFIFFFLIRNSYNYLDADLGWHLKVGEQIFTEKAVPGYDYYNFTLEGKKWVDHEWLLNLISFKLYNLFDYFGLTVFFALIVILTLIINTLFLKKLYLNQNNEDKSLSNRQMALLMFFQVLGTMAMAPHLGVRMQEFSLLFLSILLLILISFNRNKNYKILFWLIPLFYVWSCAHAGFLIGFAILFFFIGIKTCENINSKLGLIKSLNFINPLENKNILILFILGAFAVFASTLTPYGLNLYSFLSEYTNTFYMKLIAEWLPAYYFPIQYKQLVYLAIVTAGIILFSINTYFSWKKDQKPKLDLWLLATSLLFLALSFKSKRHFPLFFIVSLPLIIQLADAYLTYPPDFFKYLKNNKIIKFYLLIGFILASLNLFVNTNLHQNPFDKKHYCEAFPCEAIDFLQTNNQYSYSRIFNSYDWGGYMIWAMPENKIFIDGRLPQYKFAEHTLLQEYLEFFKEGKTEEKLNQYGIDLIIYKKTPEPEMNKLEKYLLAPREKENEKNFFREYLENNEKWEIIFEDKISKIYILEK